ncbi:phosphate ABC transporter permease PstA [bacterium]|nr:phosphate ABC transporter permease PstA [bacterium]
MSRAVDKKHTSNDGAARGGTRYRGSGVVRSKTSLLAHGEPMVWLTGGALALSLAMIVGLFLLVLVNGFGTFWPMPLTQITAANGDVYLGEITRHDRYRPTEQNIEELPESARAKAQAILDENQGWAQRRLIRTGNFELTNTHFHWISDYEVTSESLPEWAVIFERLAWGRFYGVPIGFTIDDEAKASSAPEVWDLFEKHFSSIRERFYQIRKLEKHDVGAINAKIEQARLALRYAELNYGKNSSEYQKQLSNSQSVDEWSQDEFEQLNAEIAELRRQNERYKIVMKRSNGDETTLLLAEIVRGYPANRLTLSEKTGIYLSRWREFLLDEPREANSEGGVYPAIFGTVVMTLVMAFFVVPFGVLAALYLREYAKAGPMVSGVRIAVNNLAGVPSIVYGVFGLGFFCYMVGGTIDQVFFEAKLPNPTYGIGRVLWSSLTLALLTLPVVIVATEEALSAVPNSLREGSYACGASKWQTIQRIVLPRALPGIMTGMILAMARGAGEVAPLMLVGAVKLAPELVMDGVFPYFHPNRSFMHLGFHIYDLGFQSQNSEAAKPMVYTTTLLLVAIIFTLNVAAVFLRMQLRKKFVGNKF